MEIHLSNMIKNKHSACGNWVVTFFSVIPISSHQSAYPKHILYFTPFIFDGKDIFQVSQEKILSIGKHPLNV